MCDDMELRQTEEPEVVETLRPTIDYSYNLGVTTTASEVDLIVIHPGVVALAEDVMTDNGFRESALEGDKGIVVGVRIPYVFARNLGEEGFAAMVGGEDELDKHAGARNALLMACISVQAAITARDNPPVLSDV